MRRSRRSGRNRAQNAGLLFALSLTLGAWPSPIRGGVNTWTRIGPDTDAYILSVALDRQNPLSIFAFEWSDGRAILRSRDRGESWQRIPISGGPPEYQLSLVDLATDPLVSDSLYGLARGFAPFTVMLVSRDGGETWTHAPTPDSCFNEIHLAVDPFDSDRIFVFSRRESGQACDSTCPIWRTGDAGETWNCIGPAASLAGIQRVLPSPFVPGLLLSVGTGRIYRSTDSGDTWEQVYASPDPSGFPYVHDVAWASTDSAYAATVGGGLYASLNAGLSWDHVTPGSDPDYPWQMGEIVVDPFAPQTIFALARTSLFAAQTRVLHSTDGGVNWKARETGLSGQWLSDLVIDPVTPNRLYVSAKMTGLFTYDFQEPSDCSASSTALCLEDGRFQVQALWRDFAGNSGVGKTVSIADDTGAFWFFDPANLELFVKEIDGQDTNGAFWTFYGALTNVEFSLLVTDTVTGAKHGYFNPLTTFASVGDIESFPQEGAQLAAEVSAVASRWPRSRPVPLVASTSVCAPDATTLCLLENRFAVTAEWRDFAGDSGVGFALPLTPDTGSFWFFDEGIHELAVKLIDGRDTNDAFWVFFGSLSNVQFDLRVLDTWTGETWSRRNPSGIFASGGDIEAFPQVP